MGNTKEHRAQMITRAQAEIQIANLWSEKARNLPKPSAVETESFLDAIGATFNFFKIWIYGQAKDNGDDIMNDFDHDYEGDADTRLTFRTAQADQLKRIADAKNPTQLWEAIDPENEAGCFAPLFCEEGEDALRLWQFAKHFLTEQQKEEERQEEENER